MELYSAPGRGTTFKVLLPAAPAAVRSGPEDSERDQDVAGAGPVLVADEDESIRGIVCAALERHGYSALPAEDGEAALALFEQAAEQVCAVVLDAGLTGITAPDLAGYIRRRRPEAPLVISTAYPESVVRGRFAPAEPVAYLAKPYTAERFLRTVAQAWRAGLQPRTR
jgi:CheY-like chemotaxis protein